MSPGVYIRERDKSRYMRFRLNPTTPSGEQGGDNPPEPVVFNPYYVYGSGDNTVYQLFLPWELTYISTTEIPITDVVQMGIMDYYNVIYALKSDNTLWAWGYSDPTGRMFNGIVTGSNIPVQLSGSWSQIAVGYDSIIGIRTDGTLWGWGDNYEASLGLGDTNPRLAQTQIGSANDWLYISMGGFTSQGIRASGSNTLWGWGDNYSYYPLGIGVYIDFYVFGNPIYRGTTATTPTLISGSEQLKSGWAKVVTTEGYSYGLKTDGTIWVCGGIDGNYDTGLGINTGSVIGYTQIGTASNWIDIQSGAEVSDDGRLALNSYGELYTWGWNAGYMGFDDGDSRYVPTRIDTDTWVSCSHTPNEYAFHAIRNDGTLWGAGRAGEMIGYGGNIAQTLLTQVGTDTDWIRVFNLRNKNTFAVKSDGKVYGWGTNQFYEYIVSDYQYFGFFGSEPAISTSSISEFQNIFGTKEWASITSYPEQDAYFTIKQTDNTLWAWGQNSWGQLGTGDKNIISQSRQVGTDAWKVVSTGYNTSAGITTNDKLYTWGYGKLGQLGTGDLDDRLTPTLIANDSNWKAVSVGYDYMLGIKIDGTLWSWGSASFGQMGLGVTQSFANTPTQIGSDSDWNKIHAFTYAAFAIKNDGSLYGWGINTDYSLGLPVEDAVYAIPTLISSDSWKMITSAFYNTYGIKSDDTLWGWGMNEWNVISSGGMISTPTQVISGNWKTVASSYIGYSTEQSAVCAIKSDNTLWCWGRDGGKLGANVAVLEEITQIGSDTDWEQISMGSLTSIALKNN